MNRQLPHLLKFRDTFLIATLSQSKVQLRSVNSDVFDLHGESVSYIIPNLLMLLDGTKPLSYIFKKLDYLASSEVIENYVEKLYDADIVVDIDKDLTNNNAFNPVLKFLSTFSLDSQSLLDKISPIKTAIISQSLLGSSIGSSLWDYGFRNITFFKVSDIDSQNMGYGKEDSLRSASIPFDYVIKKLKDFDIIISLLPHLDADLLDELNRISILNDIPWLPIDIESGPFCSIGPLVISGCGPCYECFRSRIRSNLGWIADSYDDFINFQRTSRVNSLSFDNFPAAIEIVSAIVSLEIFKLISEIQVPRSLGHNLIIDLMSLEIKHDRVLQIPRCIACSNSESASKGHWSL